MIYENSSFSWKESRNSDRRCSCFSGAAAASAVIVLSIITIPLNSTSGVNVAQSPESLTVVPSESIVATESFPIVPQNFEVSPAQVDSGSAPPSPEFILPLTNRAFAIPSTDLSVTSDEWAVPTASSGPIGIAADSSNNIYFTENSGNKIGRLVPGTNVITEWGSSFIPSTFSAPSAIAADSSDNIYFTEGNNKIGRLS